MKRNNQVSDFYSLRMYRDLTLRVFLQTCSATGKDPDVGVSSLNPQRWGTKPWALHREMPPSACPHGLRSGWSNSMHIATKRVKKKNVWLFMNRLCFPRRKRQQWDRVIVWVGSWPRGYAWPMHSQRTQPALSILQPHNHRYCVCSAHIIWTNASSRGSFWLRDDIAAFVSTFGLDRC